MFFGILRRKKGFGFFRKAGKYSGDFFFKNFQEKKIAIEKFLTVIV